MKTKINDYEDWVIRAWYLDADGRMSAGQLADIMWVAEQACLYCILEDLVIDDNGVTHMIVRHGKWGTAAWLRSLGGVPKSQLDIIEK